MQLIETLEARQRPYSLTLSDSHMTEADFIGLVLALLRSSACQAVALQGCESDVPKWQRQQAHVLLLLYFQSDHARRMYVDDGSPYDQAGSAVVSHRDLPTQPAQVEFRRMLLKRWIMPAKVRSGNFEH